MSFQNWPVWRNVFEWFNPDPNLSQPDLTQPDLPHLRQDSRCFYMGEGSIPCNQCPDCQIARDEKNPAKEP